MMISVTGLRKAFKKQVVLDGIDLSVPAGSIYALLGPNGAGKTTTVQILSTLMRPDGGEVRIGGYDLRREPDAIRALIGVTGQFSAVDPILTGEENLMLMANLRHLDRSEGKRRSADLLKRFDLADAGKKQAASYSGGMRRKLDLAMGLIGNPQLIFLDEPTTGLDPRSRQMLWESIQMLAASGITILLTTQYLDEADRLADRVGVLDKGKLVVEGTPSELKRRIPGGHVQLEFADPTTLQKAAQLFGIALNGASEGADSLTLKVALTNTVTSLRAILERLDSAAIAVTGLSVQTPTLDDVFLAFTAQSK
jgi:ABC-2 type transport system ATP-binding protein